MRSHIIPLAANGMPLGKYIRRAYPLIDAVMLRRALAKRDFKLDGARIGEKDAVRGGAELCCYMADEYMLGAPLNVIYSDADLAVIVKPAGMTCQRDAQGIGEDTLEHRVGDLFHEAYLVNRLDHFTGGVMPIALNTELRDELLAAFKAHEAQKTYVCQVVGQPEKPYARLINYAIKSSDESFVRVLDAPRPGALTMELEYDTVESGLVSRLRVRLMTGRTHQIRAQLSHAGLPVLGDDKYGDRAANKKYGAQHQRLWCEEIGFTTGKYAGQIFSQAAPF